MSGVSVRYIVDDVDAAIDFYCGRLGFREVMHPAPAFAMLQRDALRLLLSAPNPQGGGGRRLADGSSPEPGGWNRFSLEVDDVEAEAARLRETGATLRSGVITGVGGRQLLVQDPAGNLVELFEPTRPEAHFDPR
ncbi:VOC family protein [Intrasporangium sp.]|uniref:VOC family protein n=1 Tax=Intrasporangium sp. TaxID=1925024 RepID=UPI003221A8BE